jgi:hypothetical protein
MTSRYPKVTPQFTAPVVIDRLSAVKSHVEWCGEHQIATAVLADV